ncbi:hypothetical protein N7491_002778 [Penicillium cf. griseofulvum]|uniref:Uncharacterized protein n=1 Tax=Penicillium cf. griseofulvum TaxID=2972120 RepID=A0A9W9MSC8_9EURO|nr:hypothetical protein N7472_003055 [Penicillium cf. griseofulvum]KAJ5440372.1 hypothetical protein N7491_002778 [Penicillium cf. griseofulvum]KAJ5448419.1 hypothetical protein N7445_003240 [Penicillium cf. griseofulvum]
MPAPYAAHVIGIETKKQTRTQMQLEFQGGLLLKGICHPPPLPLVTTSLTSPSIPSTFIHLHPSTTFSIILCLDIKESASRVPLSSPPAHASAHHHDGVPVAHCDGWDLKFPFNLQGIWVAVSPLTLSRIRSCTSTSNISQAHVTCKTWATVAQVNHLMSSHPTAIGLMPFMTLKDVDIVHKITMLSDINCYEHGHSGQSPWAMP